MTIKIYFFIKKIGDNLIPIDLTTGEISRNRLIKNLTTIGEPFSEEELSGSFLFV